MIDMKTIVQIFFLSTFGLLIFYSCSKENEELSVDYSYYPDSVGHWIVYDVHKTSIDQSDTTEDIYFQLKEVIESKFFDTEGRETMRIERYIRSNETLPWQISDVWMGNLLAGNVQIVEENVRFIKLVFPVVENKSWNGNAFNTMNEEIYEIISEGIADTINNQVFDKVCYVMQADEESYVHKKFAFEKFAAGVGLVEKQYIYVESQDNFTIPIMERIEKGTILEQKIVSYQ